MGLGAIGLIGGLVSTGVQIYGMNQQAEAAEAAAKYNADLAEREASNKELETSEAIKRERLNNRAGLADLRARLSTGGTLTTSGAPLLLMGEAAGRLEVGIADAARSAGMQASSLRAQGAMGLWEAEQQSAAAKIGMIGAGISGISNAFGQYQQGSYQGLNYFGT